MLDLREKLSGVLIPVFALRRKGDLGIGDTACMKDAVDFCARNSLSVLQVLPINETGGDNSPYNAISSVALDPVLLTVEPGVIPGLRPEDYDRIVAESGNKQESADSIQYRNVKKLKLALLRSAWNSFAKEADGSLLKEFESFKKHHESWLKDYALFRTLVDENGGNSCWIHWSSEFSSPAVAEKFIAESARRAEFDDYRNFYSFVQWLAFKQWIDLRRFAEQNNVRLMGDIPFGISRYSADVWAHPELFNLDWSGGAPPEKFFELDPFTCKWGQNWGIPLYNWERHEKENYGWWRQRVERLTDVFHYFRIDHVLGFFRIYSFPWIPERNGEFLDLSEAEAEKLTGGRLPQFLPRPDEPEEFAWLNSKDGEMLLRMILAAAGKNGVIAEDLGIVPDYVRPVLHQLGIAGFAIPIFERNEDKSFKQVSELEPLSLTTYGTHDHLPLTLFYEDLVARWLGQNGHEAWLDLQRLMRFLGLNPENPPREFTDELHLAFLRTLLFSPCWLVAYTISDLLGTRERFNVPGLSSESNWSCRLPMSLAEYEADKIFGAKIKSFTAFLRESRRVARADAAGTIK